jgi:hypothetical protein
VLGDGGVCVFSDGAAGEEGVDGFHGGCGGGAGYVCGGGYEG